jgi:hypothetical protein
LFLGLNFGNGYLTLEVTEGQSASIHLEIAQTGSVQIPAVDTDGDAIDFTSRTLQFIVQDFRGAVVMDLADGSITRGSGTFTIPLNAGTTQKKRTLRWRLLDVSGGGSAELVEGYFPVY